MSAEGPVLAIDTATRRLSVAVVSGEGCLAELHDDDDRIHSERLLPAIDHVLGEAKLAISELGGIALSVGPGSFTGLRIGLATVKGLCFEDAFPVAPVSTLAALTLGAGEAGPRGALLDARRGEVYAGWYDGAVEGAPNGEGVYLPEELAPKLPRGVRLAVAEDAGPFAEELARLTKVELVPDVRADARRVGELGRRLFAAGQGLAAAGLVPRYVRRAEAEVRLTGLRFESS